jgi:Rad3-related DNA helicase
MVYFVCPNCKITYSIKDYDVDKFCKKCDTYLQKKVDIKKGAWKQLFPYRPYPQQIDFMNDIEKVVSAGGVLIAEACNGFGKTASCISSLLAMRKKIVYATRTHEQVYQVLTELKKINKKSRRNYKAVNLASRIHLCINPECKGLPQNEIQEMCHAFRKNDDCDFESYIEDVPGSLPSVLDRETLILEGQRRNVCPYYLSRLLSKKCDVTVTPYPYVFNPMIRFSTGLDLENKVLILDEGHNIDQIGQEILSDTLSERGLAAAVEEIKLIGKTSRHLDRLETFLHEQKNEKPTIVDPRVLKSDLETTMNLDLNEFIDIHSSYVDVIKAKKLQAGNPPVSFLNGVIRFLELIQDSEKSKYIGIYTRNYYGANIIEYRCLDPRLAIKPVIDMSESVLIMSGTITPIDLFAEIIGQTDSTQKVYPSIQDPRNVRMVIEKGVSTIYRERTIDMITRIGNVLSKEIKEVKKGTLIFFTQRAFMNTCLDIWIKKGIIKSHGRRLSLAGKTLYREGRDAKQNRGVVKHYKSVANSLGGAILCCVFRGRNSEGSNFPDDEARAIILVGVPYANYGDPVVRAQIGYYNKQKRGLGHKWYKMDAFRAANQSIGRGIRGREDWCHYWLMDWRYAENQNMLSKWALGEGPEIKNSFNNKHEIENNFFGNLNID